MTFVLPDRARDLERMETEAKTPEDLARCLRDIDRLTALARGHRPTLAWLDRIAAGRSRLSLLDIGCGDGALLRRIHAWARRTGPTVTMTGVDLDARAIAAARAATEPASGIRYIQADARVLALTEPFDIILGLHLAHHLADADLPPFLAWLDRSARLGWHLNDLRRSPVAALLTRVAALPFHRFVRHDAPLSVRRGFTRADWHAALAAAGLDPTRIAVTRHAPFRWSVGTDPERLP